jgi:pSer/pThr/pTyr-binding forkhead associated (FHA) protein
MGIRFSILTAYSQEPGRQISYEFDQERIVIGRGAGADIRLPFRTVSEIHATVQLEGDDYAIIDNNSTNGTRINGEKLTPERPKLLRHGDEIDVGGCVISISTRTAVTEPITAERTAELARRLVREVKLPSAVAIELPYLVVLNGVQEGQRVSIPLPPAKLLVGRGELCELKLADANVSREHFEVVCDIDGVLLRNLDSKNGVVFGDQWVQERRLKNGCEFVVGSTQMRFQDPAEESIRALADEPDILIPKEAAIAESAVPSDSDERAGSAGDTNANEDKPIKTGKRGSYSIGVDILIYTLAITILFLSIAGLVFLLRMG